MLDNWRKWKQIIPSLSAIVFTFLILILYGTIYSTLSEQAFVRLINDTDKKIIRVWSANFEITELDSSKKDFVIWFYPVYTYDWTKEYSDGMFEYKINDVYIDIEQRTDSVVTYDLPSISKGDCCTIRMGKLIKQRTQK